MPEIDTKTHADAFENTEMVVSRVQESMQAFFIEKYVSGARDSNNFCV